MKIFFNYFGGFNPEYYQLIGMKIMDATIGDFLHYFYNVYLEKSRDSYAAGWENWYRFIRKSRFDHPKIHQFLNGMRWTFDIPEIRRYALEFLGKMARVYINSRIMSVNTKEANAPKIEEVDRRRIGSGRSSRYLINILVLDELC